MQSSGSNNGEKDRGVHKGLVLAGEGRMPIPRGDAAN